MSFVRVMVCAAFTALWMGACNDGPSTSTDGKTSWLENCTSSSSTCSPGLECLCGVCTVTCAGDTDCGGHSIAAVCVERGSSAHDTACGNDASSTAACLRRCDDSTPCPTGNRCVGRACVPGSDAGDGGRDVAEPEASPKESGTESSIGPRETGGPDVSTARDSSNADRSSDAPGERAVDAPLEAGWPPSSVGTGSCVPSCDSDTCETICASGGPCESGCCGTSAPVDQTTFPGTANAPDVNHTTIAVDSTGHVHYAYAEGFTQQITYERPEGNTWVQVLVDSAAFAVDGAPSYKGNYPSLSIGRVGGRDLVYLAYTIMTTEAFPSLVPLQGRLGVEDGQSWTFEDLPGFPVVVRSGPAGAPVVVTKSQLLERRGTTWAAIDAPDSATADITDLAVDGTGAFTVSISRSSNKVLASRIAGPYWTTEEVATGVSATDAKIAVADGAVHVGFITNGGIYYARRSGTSWVTRHVTSDSMNQLAMAVESCGTPHFVGGFVNNIATRYYRWAAGRWHSVDVDSPGCNFGDGVDLALTANAALMSFFNCPYVLSRVALR